MPKRLQRWLHSLVIGLTVNRMLKAVPGTTVTVHADPPKEP